MPRERDEVVGAAAVWPKRRSVVAVVERGPDQGGTSRSKRRCRQGKSNKGSATKQGQRGRDNHDETLVGRGKQGGETLKGRARQYGDDADSGNNGNSASPERQELRQRDKRYEVGAPRQERQC